MKLFREAMGAPEPVIPVPVVEPVAPVADPEVPDEVPAAEPEAPVVAPVLSETEPATIQEISQSSSGHPVWPSKVVCFSFYTHIFKDTCLDTWSICATS